MPNHTLTLSPGHPIVVIGYGNELRGDDAIGPAVAEQVAAWGRPDIRAIATRQLLPELAEDLARASLAIFVDARPLVDTTGAAVFSAGDLEERSPSSFLSVWPLFAAFVTNSGQTGVYSRAASPPSNPDCVNPVSEKRAAPLSRAMLEWHTLAPSAGNHSLGHTSDPQALLALAQALYGHAPPALLLAVPAVSFGLGSPLSPIARQGIEAATRAIVELLQHSSPIPI